MSSFLYLLAPKDCRLLSNGNYKFIHSVPSSDSKNKIINETRVLIVDNNFTQYWSNGDSTKGDIEWIYDCTFKLVFDKKVEETNELGKLLLRSFGDPCFELIGKRGRKIRFRTTYSGNLNVTTGEGVIIKIR